MALSDFEVGRVYKRSAIHREYGGQQQGGISTPTGRPFLLLFTGKSGELYGYQDGWNENGIFLYSGEGQRGDMTFKGGNKAMRDHARNGKDLHLFQQLRRGQVRYQGRFACGSWETRTIQDTDGTARQAIVFHLVPLEEVEGGIGAERQEPSIPVQPVSPTSLGHLRKRAIAAAEDVGPSNSRDSKRRFYERSEEVRRYVLARANGVCEACRQTAPFTRTDGTPYLEPHHTHRVSDGGPDHPRWVGGVCPNCHREIHHGINGKALNRRLQQYLATLEQRDG